VNNTAIANRKTFLTPCFGLFKAVVEASQNGIRNLYTGRKDFIAFYVDVRAKSF
jgi:hypothetical protein